MTTTEAPTTPTKFTPADWQLEDLRRLVERKYSANWSEMGCYKTTTGLWLADAQLRDVENPAILVITTKSGKGTFFQIAPEVMPNYKLFNVNTKALSIIMDGEERKLLPFVPKEFAFPAIVVTHFDVFSDCNKGKFETDDRGVPVKDPETGRFKMLPWKAGDYIIDRQWDFVWIDECHRIKNKDTRWTYNLKRVKSERRHVSTGTGMINRPSELWSPLNFLDGKTYSSFNRFKERYSLIDDWEGYEKEVGIRPENKEELRDIVFSIGVRRTLDEVMPHIKQPIFMKIPVDLNPTQRKMFDSIKSVLAALDKQGVPFHSPNVVSALTRMRQICVATPEVVNDYFDEKLQKRVQEIKLREPSSKLDALMEVIDGLEWDEESKQPLVVYSQFNDPLDLLKVRLEKKDISYLHLKQSDNDQARYQKWAIEFPKLEHRVFMCSLQLGSESINLTPARHMVRIDRTWSPLYNNQSVGRVRRPGQEGEPVVIDLEAKRTTDQRVENVNKEKDGWFKEIFGEES